MNRGGQPDRVIVSICGASGSGKTLLARRLVEHLGTDVGARVPGDRYLMPARRSIEAYLRQPIEYDWQLLERALAVPDGTKVVTPSFDFERFVRRPEPDRRTVAVTRVLVIDAIYPYPRATLRVLVTAPDDVRWRRVVERDAARGSHSAEAWGQLELTRARLDRLDVAYDLLLCGTDEPERNLAAILDLMETRGLGT